MISSWIKENENVVIALSPIAYLDAYEDFFEDSDIICFDLTDRTENVFKRLEFTDDNDNLLHIPQSYLNKHKAYYMSEIWRILIISILYMHPKWIRFQWMVKV